MSLWPILATVRFFNFTNDMVEGVNSYTSLLADDASLIRAVGNKEDWRRLQEDIENFHNWSQQREMQWNVKKCKVMELDKGKETKLEL